MEKIRALDRLKEAVRGAFSLFEEDTKTDAETFLASLEDEKQKQMDNFRDKAKERVKSFFNNNDWDDNPLCGFDFDTPGQCNEKSVRAFFVMDKNVSGYQDLQVFSGVLNNCKFYCHIVFEPSEMSSIENRIVWFKEEKSYAKGFLRITNGFVFFLKSEVSCDVSPCSTPLNWYDRSALAYCAFQKDFITLPEMDKLRSALQKRERFDEWVIDNGKVQSYLFGHLEKKDRLKQHDVVFERSMLFWCLCADVCTPTLNTTEFFPSMFPTVVPDTVTYLGLAKKMEQASLKRKRV